MDTTNALIAGILSLVISLIAAYIVHAVITPSLDLNWGLIAVGISSFFSGLGGYMAAAARRGRVTATTTAPR